MIERPVSLTENEAGNQIDWDDPKVMLYSANPRVSQSTGSNRKMLYSREVSAIYVDTGKPYFVERLAPFTYSLEDLTSIVLQRLRGHTGRNLEPFGDLANRLPAIHGIEDSPKQFGCGTQIPDSQSVRRTVRSVSAYSYQLGMDSPHSFSFQFPMGFQPS